MVGRVRQLPRAALALAVWLVLTLLDACLVVVLTDLEPATAAVLLGAVWLVVVAAIDPAAIDSTGMLGQLAARAIGYPALTLLAWVAGWVFG